MTKSRRRAWIVGALIAGASVAFACGVNNPSGDSIDFSSQDGGADVTVNDSSTSSDSSSFLGDSASSGDSSSNDGGSGGDSSSTDGGTSFDAAACAANGGVLGDAGDCYFNCGPTNNGCNDGGVTCPPNMPCYVSCFGATPNACQAKIDCSQASLCNIKCDANLGQCNGPITCGGSSCNVACSGPLQCNGGVTCTADTCSINCFTDSCKGSAHSATSGVACSGQHCSVNCNGGLGADLSCSSVFCDAGQSCDITCGGGESCLTVRTDTTASSVVCAASSRTCASVTVVALDAAVSCPSGAVGGGTCAAVECYADAGNCNVVCPSAGECSIEAGTCCSGDCTGSPTLPTCGSLP